MHSRAHLLLKIEQERIVNDHLWGVEAYPIRDNIFEWTAKILGLKDTPWQGGVFRLYIKFDENYSCKPPELCFHTIPFHPNVDMITGVPCIDFLDDWTLWNEKFSLSSVLLSIQAMLSNPVLENAVNGEAVDMIRNSARAYRQMVLDCVIASQRVEAGLDAHAIEEGYSFSPEPPVTTIENLVPPKPPLPAKKPAKISFDDYYSTWSGIATSKSTQKSQNPLLDAIKNNTALQSVHYGLSQAELDEQALKQLEEHQALMYGNFRRNDFKSKEERKQEKMDKLNQMKKIYLNPRTPSKTPGLPEETWEEEDADGLLDWTNKLDEAAL